MKTITQELKQKTNDVLFKEAENLRSEIAKLRVDYKVNPPKDTNIIFKKRKKLAVILTILEEKNH